MNLTNRTTVKNLLKKYEVRPDKYLGQHFILSKKPLAKMIAAAKIKENDAIFEIGPGLGTLTQELAKIPHPLKKGGGPKIIAIEKDPLMINILGETLADYKNVKIIQADARQLIDFKNQSGKRKYKIVANLPYNIATFLIRRWLDPPVGGPPELMVLMIQKEVAQRICAKPPHMNLLAVSTQFYATARIVDYVLKERFWPKPKVDAAIIKIVTKKKKVTFFQRSLEKQQFFNIVKTGFSHPRKQLIGNLAKKLNFPKEKLLEIFKKLSIPERARAENLSLEQWISLAISLHPTAQRK